MSGSLIQDRVSRGLGTAARVIGTTYDAFRAAGAAYPTAPINRFLQLPAAFAPDDASFRQQPRYGRSIWAGLFDTAYTRPGDYLTGAAGTFFIAAQSAFQPALCILTNTVLSLSRPAAPAAAGVNSYGGVALSSATSLLTAWPGCILAAGAGPTDDLPAAGAPGAWTILLPPGPAAPGIADLVVDAAGQTYVINTAEQTALGFRINARLAAA